MLNSVGLPGPGIDAWIERDLPALEARGARVIASIWGRSADEYAAAARPLKAVAHRLVAVEVNLSCPNVEARGNVFAHSEDATRAAMRAVVESIGDTRADVREALAQRHRHRRDRARRARRGRDRAHVGQLGDGIARSTRSARAPRLGAGGGGLTGAPIKPVALRAVWDVARAFPGVPIIGTGGVSSGVDAIEMMLAGATAVGVGTATFADPRATLRIVREMRGMVRGERRSPRSRADRRHAMTSQVATELDVAARDHLAIALDVPSLDEALRARARGRAVVRRREGRARALLRGRSRRRSNPSVTWGCACSATSSSTTSRPPSAGPRGCSAGSACSYLNFHAAGGVDMLRAGVEGVREGARDAGRAAPVPLAVTVLTSDPDASAFDARLACAIEVGMRRRGVLRAGDRTREARASRFRHGRSRCATRRRRHARSSARRHADASRGRGCRRARGRSSR